MGLHIIHIVLMLTIGIYMHQKAQFTATQKVARIAFAMGCFDIFTVNISLQGYPVAAVLIGVLRLAMLCCCAIAMKRDRAQAAARSRARQRQQSTARAALQQPISAQPTAYVPVQYA